MKSTRKPSDNAKNSAHESSTFSKSTPSNIKMQSCYQASEQEQTQFASNYGSELVIQMGAAHNRDASLAQLYALLEFCVSQRRVAPLPEFWEKLCGLIAINTATLKTLAPLPNTDLMYDSERRKRLADQLEYAYEQGSLPIADQYLRSLTLEQWLLNQWES